MQSNVYLKKRERNSSINCNPTFLAPFILGGLKKPASVRHGQLSSTKQLGCLHSPNESHIVMLEDLDTMVVQTEHLSWLRMGH